MTELDRAWLAGLLEGEGCFTISQNQFGSRWPTVRLVMTDQDVVERAAKLMGGRGTVRRWASKCSKHKTLYKFSVGGSKARLLILELLPLMGERRTARMNELLLA